MMDQLTFINPAGETRRHQRDTQARVAAQLLELRPSLQGSFGSNFVLTAAIEAAGDDAPG